MSFAPVDCLRRKAISRAHNGQAPSKYSVKGHLQYMYNLSSLYRFLYKLAETRNFAMGATTFGDASQAERHFYGCMPLPRSCVER